MTKKTSNEPYVVQYETKSSEFKYRNFWDTRSYEDRSERTLLRSFLRKYPKEAKWLLDIGGSYGRLIDSYARKFKELAITDYAANEFYIAREPARKESMKLHLVAGNAYHLPYADNSQPAVISVRMIHHLTDPIIFLKELERVLTPGGVAIIEAANKNNLKRFISSCLRANFSDWKADWLDVGMAGLQEDDSFHLIRNYKPKYLEDTILEAGLIIRKKKSVSWFRRTAVTKLPEPIVDLLEWTMQQFSSLLPMGPSNWYIVQKKGKLDGADVEFTTTLLNPASRKMLKPTEVKKFTKIKNKTKYIDLRFPKPRR